jgi:hypothetical protein
MSLAYAADFRSLRQVMAVSEKGSKAGELKGKGQKEK